MIIPLLIAISILVFIVIQLPPGDYLTTFIAQREAAGNMVQAEEAEALRREYGLDRLGYMQYFMWARNIVAHGNLGRSFSWNQPVAVVIGSRLGATMAISFLTLVIIWGVSIPIGIYSATHQYSKGDYFFTFIGFIGQAIPGFLIALALVYFVFVTTGVAMSGLFSQDYIAAPWSVAKFLNMLPRLFMVIVIIGLANTAGMIRTVRAMMLDELGKQYVITARAKGVEERTLLYKYPVRMAINPLISGIGATLGGLVSGETIVSIVLNMPTSGPILFTALQRQDMFLAGGFLLIMSAFIVAGTLLSDILLSVMDPRIRFGGTTET
jgi:peptide/nickel transport system permease protein